MLSDKADILKEQLKATRDTITQEEYRIKAVNDANGRIQEQIDATQRRQTLWNTKRLNEIDELKKALTAIGDLDIEQELSNHDALQTQNELSKAAAEVTKWKIACEQEQVKLIKTQDKLKTEIEKLEKHECYACGQAIHDDKHEQVLTDKRATMQETSLQYLANDTQLAEHINTLAALGDPGVIPTVFYDTKEDAINHKNTLANLRQQLAAKETEVDPYAEQIQEMQTQALEEIDYDMINQLTNVREHQEFLLKLLTNKDSFIRKRIIDQNLSYLNARLGQYLDRIGLPHTVKFQNDLTVSIEELGRELDFDNLSRGERNRLILSLSWAFRDVWESLYQPINLLFIDELVDAGMDAAGVEAALAVLKKMARERNKNIYLISHKDELVGRVNNVLRVIKENGFTSYSNDVDYVN
jgi:DNA repair exonuclease SbcCD ATPase subunit